MFPFFGFRNLQKNQVATSKAMEKLNKGELTVEDVLDEEDLVNEMRSYTYSQLMNFLNGDTLIKLVDYIIKEPTVDEFKIGYKYPFNSSEILCSENVFVIDKFFEDANKTIKEESEEEQSEGENLRKSIIFNRGNDLNEDEKKEVKVEAEEAASEEVKTEEKEALIEEKVAEEKKDKEDKKEEKPADYPVINHLFSMLASDSPLNYVLCGYFHKVFNHLTNFRCTQIMNYFFFQKKNFIEDMLKHLNRKSICDCLVKIIVSYSADIPDQDFKRDLMIQILERFDSKDLEKSENICEMISEMLQNRRIYYLIAKNKEVLEKIFTLVVQNLRKSHSVPLLKILIKFIDQVVKDTTPSSNKTDLGGNNNKDLLTTDSIFGEEDNSGANCINLYRVNSDSKFSGELELKNYLDIFEFIYDNFHFFSNDFMDEGENANCKEIGDVYYEKSVSTMSFNEREFKPLGVTKIYELEYFKSLLELIVNIINNSTLVGVDIINQKIETLVEKVIESKVFVKIIDFFFEYEMNNFYQIMFEKVMVLVMNKSTYEALIKHIFEDCKLGEKIKEKTFDQELSFKSGNVILPGYFAIMCQVAGSINSSENVNVNKMLDKDDELKYLLKICLLNVKNQFSKGLLYAPQSESPFQKFSSMSSMHSQSVKDESSVVKHMPLRVFVNVFCSIKFDKFKESRKKVLEEGNKFDVDEYINQESEPVKIDLKTLTESIYIDADDPTQPQGDDVGSEIPISEAINNDSSNLYSDTYYYWKNYQIEVDLAELEL